MNQTQKRLSIINYAISITDMETIHIQTMKLGMLKSDEKIQEIITAIGAENYAQAQRLITQYINTPVQNVIQRTTQASSTGISKEDQAVIDDFSLFVTPSAEKKAETVDINDFFADMPAHTSAPKEPVDFTALLELEAQDVLSDNIEIDTSHTSTNTFFKAHEERVEDTFFDTHTQSDKTPSEEILTESAVPTQAQEEPATTASEENNTAINNDIFSQNDLFKELKPKAKVQQKISDTLYKAIPYLSQKLDSMQKLYPATDSKDSLSDSASTLIHKISQEGYSEKEIQEILKDIAVLTEAKNIAQAAQLLLICAATESEFAQFMFARELYKGILFEKNIPESFARMSALASEDYPEALCDLAQFYEYGVGTARDLKKAEQYYKEATEAGIPRAEKHYARLKKENRSFFGL